MSEVTRYRAVVIDDDPVLRKVLVRALDRLDFDCTEFKSGEEATDAIAEIEPVLALVDIEMPGIDGFETTRRIREQLGDRVAILVATGHNDRATIDRAFDAGASDFVDKPFDWTLLEHRVRFLMRAHHAFTSLVENEQRLAQAQRLAKIGHWEWHRETNAMVCSEEARLILDLGIDEPLSLDGLVDCVHPDEAPQVRKGFARAIEGTSWTMDHRVGTEDAIIVRQQVEPQFSATGQVQSLYGTIQDITERERTAEQIRSLAYYDALTGLPNERMLHEHVEDLAAVAAETQSRFALLRLSIDRFDDLAATIGPRHRDEVVLEIAARVDLQLNRAAPDTTKANVTFARMGNEHFAIVIRNPEGPEAPQTVASQILDIMRAPFMIDDRAMSLTVSLGIAIGPDDGDDVFSLLHSAEMALAEAQAENAGSYRLANPGIQQHHERRFRIELALRDALASEGLVAAYQPQWSPKTGEIAGVELLSRWTDAELGVVSPGEFVPIAEDTGLIAELSRWTIRTACRQLGAWQRAGIPPMRISINVSPRFVESGDALDYVRAQIAENDVDPRLLECEFTETAMIGSHEVVQRFAESLRELGLRTALDDFGTGYSSLQHLVRFPLDCVKIDLSFVRRIEEDHAARAICQALLAMARELELEVVAEGVETEAQMRFLAERGCDLLQGYLLSPAVAPECCIELREADAGLRWAPRGGASLEAREEGAEE